MKRLASISESQKSETPISYSNSNSSNKRSRSSKSKDGNNNLTVVPFSSPILSFRPQLYSKPYEKQLKLDFNYWQIYSSLDTSTHLTHILKSLIYNDNSNILGFECSTELSNCKSIVIFNLMGISPKCLEAYMTLSTKYTEFKSYNKESNLKTGKKHFLKHCTSIPLDYTYHNDIGKISRNKIISATEALLNKRTIKPNINNWCVPKTWDKFNIAEMFRHCSTVIFNVTYDNMCTDSLCFTYDNDVKCKFNEFQTQNDIKSDDVAKDDTNSFLNDIYGEFYRDRGSNKGYFRYHAEDSSHDDKGKLILLLPVDERCRDQSIHLLYGYCNNHINKNTLIFDMSDEYGSYKFTFSHVINLNLNKSTSNGNSTGNSNSNITPTVNSVNDIEDTNIVITESIIINNITYENDQIVVNNQIAALDTNDIDLKSKSYTHNTINLSEIGTNILCHDKVLQYLLLDEDMLALMGYPDSNEAKSNHYVDTATVKWKFYLHQQKLKNTKSSSSSSTSSTYELINTETNLQTPETGTGTSSNHIYFYLEDGEEEEEGEEKEEEEEECYHDIHDDIQHMSQATNEQYLKICSIDCEMCYTDFGLELTRVTVVCPFAGIVLDDFVKPTNPIIDYNTEYSGVSEDDLAQVTRTIEDIHGKLSLIINSDTVIVGHSTDSDLRALKLVHKKVIDTAALYPHDQGLPYKNSLRNLAKKILNKDIQLGSNDGSGQGHDSAEDAITALELAFYKAKLYMSGITEESKLKNNETSTSLLYTLFHDMIQHNHDRKDIHVSIQSCGMYQENPSWERICKGYNLESCSSFIAESFQKDLIMLQTSEQNNVDMSITENTEFLKPQHTIQWCNHLENAKSFRIKHTNHLNRFTVLSSFLDALTTEKNIDDKSKDSENFVWLDIPFDDDDLNQSVSVMSQDTYFLSQLEIVDSKMHDIYDKCSDGTLFMIMVQGNLFPLQKLVCAKQRYIWDMDNNCLSSQRKSNAQYFKENDLIDQLKSECSQGVAFFRLKS